MRDAELGERLADKLVKIYRTDGEESWILVHLEIQSQEESNFAARMPAILTAGYAYALCLVSACSVLAEFVNAAPC